MPIKSVDAKTLKEWLDKNEALVIDVREPNEYTSTHIAGAKLIPLGTIKRKILPDFGNQKLVVHCGIGKRSAMACEKLLLEDPNLPLYNLEGGITAWRNAGFETQTSTKSSMSLDRQIQITISAGILIGLMLGYFIHPAFLLLSAFFGLVLLFMGVSASPTVLMLMASMPWNKNKD